MAKSKADGQWIDQWTLSMRPMDAHGFSMVFYGIMLSYL